MHDVLNYTITDAVKVSGLGRTRLYELPGSGKIAAVKCGTRTPVKADSLRR